VFRDIATLREGLARLASNDAPSASGETNWINVDAARRKVAYVYDGWDDRWRGIAKGLYDTEPVLRGVLDHCEALFRNEKDASLLDPLFGGEGTENKINDPAWTDPAAYALQCAVTALWSSLDVRPGVVCGRGVGEIAAAQTAGAFTLDEGLRIASARGETVRAMDEDRSAELAVEEALTGLDGINVSTPALAMVSAATGNEVGVADVLDFGRWLHQTLVGEADSDSARPLADLAVDTLIEIGPGSEFAVDLTEAWPEVPAGEAATAPALFGGMDAGDGFLQAVKAAYDTGLPVSPEGLFAGESRRRRSLPGYPFQRRRFWID
jgi:acyl transferase domain-containing protein